MSTTATLAPPPRWAVRAAHAIPLVTLPSGLWRVALATGASMGVVVDGEPFAVAGWEIAYVLGLSLVAELTALLTVGLVKPWGERVPAWMPLIGGRTVPARPVVVIGALGAIALQLIWGWALVGALGDGFQGEFTGSGWAALMIACYAPLLLWAPLTAAVTYSYWRRRR